ncbi:hypothetical protein MKEN_00158600 [Mycena kentingensis (nom. inval.)]|nr:hypothetical protein MKEN_00158600 [Mycena kentingensis (nom. inval.)]
MATSPSQVTPTPLSSLEALSDANILARFNRYQRLPAADHPFTERASLFVITDDTVGKLFENPGIEEDLDDRYPAEAFTLEVVAKYTSIPVPRVHRIVRHTYGWIIVMDRVPGRQLSTLWPAMSDAEKEGVVEQLTDYIRQLRAIDIPNLHVPGPMDREMLPRVIDSEYIFGSIGGCRGPFASYDDLAAFFEQRRGILRDSTLPHIDKSYPLVVTHEDLHPRNLVLDETGKLWVVDWGSAGVYPEWWEALAMEQAALYGEVAKVWADPSWKAIIPRVCGEYPDVKRWIISIEQTFNLK